MKRLKLSFNMRQVKALLKKDVLVRLRQPWMTIIQFVWPCIIFASLYLLRNRFQPKVIEDCQFPTRLLPAKDNLLPFFHSYICTIENKCQSTIPYEEYSHFEDAPLTPVLKIVQTFLNENSLYEAVTGLPKKMNFVVALTTLATHPKFSVIQAHIQETIKWIPKIEEMLGENFDIKQLFADNIMFSKSGNVICGKPFPRNDNIRYVDSILESEDFSTVNADEVEAMPTPYCKQLYRDITTNNNGKMTWTQLKPIIQGRIVYGPKNDETSAIINQANSTLEDFYKLRNMAAALKMVLQKIRTEKKSKESFLALIALAKSPFVKSALGNTANVNDIESVMNVILTDKRVYEVAETVNNIFECFSVDRFIAVNSEKELERVAFELSKKRLFFAGLYFNKTETNNVVYKVRMESDNSPVTIEMKNRFWFPGPEASMVEDLRYHRGFIQIKHIVDIAIAKYKKTVKLEAETTPTEVPRDATDDDDDWFANWGNDESSSFPSRDVDENSSTTTLQPPSTMEGMSSEDGPNFTNTTLSDSMLSGLTQLISAQPNSTMSILPPQSDFTLSTPPSQIGSTINISAAQAELTRRIPPPQTDLTINNLKTSTDVQIQTNIMDKMANFSSSNKLRVHRRIRRQLGGLLGLLLGGSSKKETKNEFRVDEILVYTKQFPYPSYVKDDFKRGLYLAQSVQMAFFMALIVQIATCIRYRIWMKESKNTMLMRSMGLEVSSEILSWAISTFLEIIIIFVLACVILYSGGIIQHTNIIIVFVFLLVFGLCVISFCYLCSNAFSSASIGSVASSILFLMTFMPYIVIICLDTKLTAFLKFITNLSLSTAFCYAWDHIMRLEIQEKGLSFSKMFEEEFGYALCMIILDIVLYAVVGYIIAYLKNDEFKFHRVPRSDMDVNVGASIENVSVIYNNSSIAVSNISTTFRKNHVTCLLGRNGAGKSTIIKMITGQVKPSSGSVMLSQALTDPSGFQQVGICSQDNVLIPHLTAREHLNLYAKIKLRENFDLEVVKTLRSLKFGKYENYEASKLSGGYQRRLCVAIAFIGSPNVVILDEPCSGVDMKARRCVWELIETLRWGRTVVLTTHQLNEAEILSDSILILNEGKVIAEHNPQTLKTLFTKTFDVLIKTADSNNEIMEVIKSDLGQYLEKYNTIQHADELRCTLPYNHENNKEGDLFQYLENLQKEGKIKDISVTTKTLEEVFNSLNAQNGIANGYHNGKYETIDLGEKDEPLEPTLGSRQIVKSLLWKRLLHFRRNFKVLLCVIILPVLFEVIAMGFMQLRPIGQYDNQLNLSRSLYSGTTEFLGMENGSEFTRSIHKQINDHCEHCRHFNNSEKAFRWILDTNDKYQMNRYGGITFNQSRVFVWYNNKGYHSMAAWLNDLNSHMLQIEMENTSYQISTINHPMKVGDKELSTSSILQQVADAGISLIILIAFSLVVAGSSVFIVNERVSGEKLQQKLCGITFSTYWSVAFFWDFLVYLMALVLCVVVFKIFNIPVYVDKSNLNGICLLLVLYGFASINAVHVIEKLFAEASFANMSIFCLNVIIPLATLTIIILFDILGESEQTISWRNFLNRAFLIFPQHALADGLIEICKNYIVAQLFLRFDIDSYKSPVSSNLLKPHYISFVVVGLIFFMLNYLIESNFINKMMKKAYSRNDYPYELKIVSIQNSLVRNNKDVSFSECYALKVDNLCKSYKKNDLAVRNVSFYVRLGECFGLLGKNGAGKSTIFKMLSGQLYPLSGSVNYYNREISYCPQSSALDPLLTVAEVIEFYGKLRRVKDIPQLVSRTTKSFHLSAYEKVLVKNLSGGNRRKLNVAVTCFGNPSVVLMDEPTSDMDPVTRSLVYGAIKKLVSEQRAVLLTSHSVSEIEEVCNRIGVLKHGKLINNRSPEELKNEYGSYYMVTFFSNKPSAASLEKDIREMFPNCFDFQRHPHTIKYIVKMQANVSQEKQHEVLKTGEEGSIAEFVKKLKNLSKKHASQYTLAKCRLDTIFEKILDNNELDGAYVHKGFDQTETNI